MEAKILQFKLRDKEPVLEYDIDTITSPKKEELGKKERLANMLRERRESNEKLIRSIKK